MTATLAEPLIGCEAARLFTPPRGELTPQTTLGFEAAQFATGVLGIGLMPWQEWLLHHALELNPDGSFRFRTVVVQVARQNGKSTWAQVIALWRMFVDRAPLVIGTAQNLDVAEEVWAGAVEMAEAVPELAAEIAAVNRTNGQKALRLVSKERYRVAAASRRGGRGLSGDLALLDEIREHRNWDAWAAVTKTTMARPRPQVVALSNAGDDSSIVLNHLRAQGLETLDGTRGSLALFEWSAPDGCDVADRAGWAQANPALGYTITAEAIEAAMLVDPEWVFRTEVLCQRVDVSAASPLPLWPDRAEPGAMVEPGGPVGLAVDVSWNRGRAWIAAAVRLPDGRAHLEAVDARDGTEWVVPRLVELAAKWSPLSVAVQASGAPASTLLGELEEMLDVPVVAVGGADLARSCGMLFDAVANGAVRHPGQSQVDEAARHAAIRPLGDAWVFDRKRSAVDIAGLMAEALALWVLSTVKPKPARSAPRRIR